MNYKGILGLGILSLATVFLFVSDITLGSVQIPFIDVINAFYNPETIKESWRIIILDSRLPKALTAIVCGFALSISGLQMQTLFKNPLAGPYILGISSGAGLGVALVTIGLTFFSINLNIQLSYYMVIISAIIGASVIMGLIFLASLKVKDIMTVLILGIMLAAIINAFIGIMQYFSTASQLKTYIIWTFGSLDGVNMSQVSIMLIVTLLTAFFVFTKSKSLNLLLLGENYASSMGVKIIPLRLMIIISTGILAGGVTAFCGPVGFIGIVVPHLCRMMFKSSDHRLLIPASALMGAVFMLTSDIISHLPGSEGILPLNSVTAILGIPVIIWILLSKKSISRAF